MVRKFVFELVVPEGTDEFWETVDTAEGVREEILALLREYGWYDITLNIVRTDE